MNKEQQDKLWNELSESRRTHLKSMFINNQNGNSDEYTNGYLGALIDLFGEHNLNPEPPTPKTWEDMKKIYNEWPRTDLDNKIDKMCSAATKIAKLIELGYGGMVSEEEWWNDNILKYYIKCNPHKSEPSIECTYHASVKYFIAFHTQQQAEEFMSYESNRQLVGQFFMM